MQEISVIFRNLFTFKSPNALLMENLDDLMAKLPPELQQEVRDFAFFLAEKKAKPNRRKLRLNWA
jgi:hypothetical protein